MTDIAHKHTITSAVPAPPPKRVVTRNVSAPHVFQAMSKSSAGWLIGFWLALGIPTLIYPFGRDQGVFAYIGERLLDGARLYVDLWDVKSPLVYWLYGFALKLSNSQTIGVRVMDMLLVAFTVYLIYTLAVHLRRTKGERVGVIAGILYLLWYYLPNDYRVLANCESFISPFLALGILLVVVAAQNPGRSLRLWFWGGMALGATTLLKTTGLVFVVPALGAALFLTSERSWRRRMFSAGALVSGFILPLALGWLYLVRTGAVEDWLFMNLTYLPSYTAVSHSSSFWIELIRPGYILAAVAIIYPALVAGVALFSVALITNRRKHKKRANVSSSHKIDAVNIVLIFGLVYAGVIVVQGKYLHYHFLPLLAPFSALVAIALLDILEDFRASGWAKTLALLVLALGLVKLWEMPSRYLSLGRMIATDGYEQRYCEKLSTGNFSCATSREVGEYLRMNAQPGDRLLVWSFEPEIYFLSGLEPSSRFLYNTPFFAGSISAAWKTEFMLDLLSQPPTFVVVGENDGLPLITGDDYSSSDRLDEVEGLNEFLRTNYEPVKVIDKFTILKRRMFGAYPQRTLIQRL